MTELEEFRAQKDQFFGQHPQSPLTPGQQAHFDGLAYYPENPGLLVEAPVEEFPDKDVIQMTTSTGGVASYERWGQFSFDVDGQEARLTLYRDLDRGDLFLPFVDSKAGEETYGAGRYLEPELVDAQNVVIDFNLAYNPYCAYNENWSCPIPPFENRLQVPIQAGEKNFTSGGH